MVGVGVISTAKKSIIFWTSREFGHAPPWPLNIAAQFGSLKVWKSNHTKSFEFVYAGARSPGAHAMPTAPVSGPPTSKSAAAEVW